MRYLFILFTLVSVSVFGQSGSPTYGGVFYRVTDSATYVTQAAAKHAAGYADIFYSVSSQLFWKWNGSAYELLGSGFWPLTGTGTLTGNTTIDGNNKLLTFTDLSNLLIESNGDIDLDPADDLKLNGTSGVTGQFIGNVNGQPVWATPAGGGGGGSSGVLDVNTSQVGNVGAGEDVLWSYTLPGDTLSTDEQGIYIRVAGSSTVNGNNKRIKLKFGDDLIVDPGINNLTLTWSLDCQVIRVNGTTLKSNCQVVTIGSGQTHTVLDDITETLSGDVVIQLTGEAVDDNDIIKESATVIRMEGGGGSGGAGGGDVNLADFVVSETPAGDVDGVNDTFIVANEPVLILGLYVDGLLQEEGGGNDYTVIGDTFTMVVAPLTGSKVRVSYIK